MGKLKAKIQFYNSMASMYEVGLPLSKALRQRHSWPIRRPALEMAEEMEMDGTTFSEQMRKYPWLFSKLECQLVRAGEETGHLDRVFKSIASWFELQRKLRGQIIADMIYPIMLFHFAAVMIPLISFLTGQATLPGVFLRIICFLAPPYFLLALLIASKFLKAYLDFEIPSAVSKALLFIPVFGTLARKLDYARFFNVYSLAIESGMPMRNSVRLGADACRSSFMRRMFLDTAARIEMEGCSFTEAFFSFIFPGDKDSPAIAILESGEISGKIHETARKTAETFQYESEESMKLMANIIPKAIYIVIVIYMAVTIIGFWSNLYSNVNRML